MKKILAILLMLATPAAAQNYLRNDGIFYSVVEGTTSGQLLQNQSGLLGGLNVSSIPLTVGSTPILGGTTNGLLYNAAGVLGNLSTTAGGLLNTNGSGVPSITTTPTLLGTLTITPPAATLNQGVSITQTGPTSGSTVGPWAGNLIDSTFSSTVTGSSDQHFDYGAWQTTATAHRVNFTVGGANLNGEPFLAGFYQLRLLSPASPAGDGDFLGFAGSAYTNVAAVNAGLHGVAGSVILGNGANIRAMNGFFSQVDVLTGALVERRRGINIVSQGDTTATSTFDTAINFGTSTIANAFKHLFIIDTGTSTVQPMQTTGDFFWTDGTFTVASIFNLPTATVTANIFNFSTFTVAGPTGFLKSGTGTADANSGAIIQGAVASGGVASFISKVDSTTGFDGFHTNNSTNAASLYAAVGEPSSTVTIFGQAFANWAELVAANGNGLLIGALAAKPTIFGALATEYMRGQLGLQVGTTSRDAAGVVNAGTGFNIAGAAASGNVLRGNGTNFVSAQLACSDLSGVGTGCAAAAGITALTGDVTASGSGSVVATLATVASAGTTGSSTAIPVITINVKGLTTSITTAAVVAPAGTLTGATLASGVTASSLTSVGTLVGGATGAGFTIALTTSTVTGTLPCANHPALTGDVTTSAGNCATTLASVASAGTTGSSTAIPVITINAKGLTTSITTAAVVAPAGTLTGATLAAGVTASSLTSVGTLSSLTMGGTLAMGSNSFTSTGTVTSAAHTITSASATALTVGLNGATNPAFTIDASTASQAAGFKITGAATGGTVALAAIDSGSNTNITINAKGSGTIGIGSISTGAVTITPALNVTGATAVGSGATPNSGVNLSVSNNTVGMAAITNTGNTVAQFSGADNTQATLLLDSFGSSGAKEGFFLIRTARGTQASYSASQSGDFLGFFGMIGATAANTFGSNTAAGGGIFFGAQATENWSSTNQGAKLAIYTSATGGTALAAALTLQTGLQIGSPTGGDKGVGTINIPGPYYVNGTAGITRTCTIAVGNVLTFTLGILTATSGAAGCV